MNNTISIVTRDVNEFLKHPLIIWAETFLETDTKLTYEQLINSTCFHAIIRSIDPRLQNCRLPDEAADTNSRLVNLDFTLRSIRSFVQDVLRYIIVAKLPNIYLIAHEPYAEYSFEEIERILLLLLACSVSGGDRKDIHIQQLARLNESIQQSLMPYIEELTNDINTILQPREYFFNDIFNTDHDQRLKCLFTNLIHLIHERDRYFEEILELEQDKESLKQKLELYQSSSSNLISTTGTNLHTTPSQTSLNTFLNELEIKNPGIETTEYKTKMRQMKSDLDDQMDTIETMREEFEVLQTEVTRLKNENFELSQNARLIRVYRDEIDTLNYKLTQMEKDQQEFSRCKERVQQGEIFKKQMEELQNENKLLSQDRSHLEEQIEEYRSRINEMFQSEMNVMKFKHDIENLTYERDLIQEKLSTILEDKVRLELDLNSTTHTVDTLNHQLQQVKSREDFDQTNSLSISFQIQQTIKNRLLQTDLEKKQLHDQLTSLKERYEIDMHRKRIEEEKQNIHIQLLTEQINEYVEHLKSLEIHNDQLMKEKFQLENQSQDQRIEHEKIRSDLQANNQHLKLTLNTLQQREQMESNAKFQDIERENQRLQERIQQMIQQISQLQIEHEHLILVKEREGTLNERLIQLQLKSDQLAREHLTYEKRCEIYEKNLQHYQTIEQECLELKHQNQFYQVQINQLEKQYLDQQIDVDRLEKDNEHLQQLMKKLHDASDFTRTIEIKLKKKQDESDQLKQTIAQLKQEKIVSQDQLEQSIHHSFKQTIETLNHHIQDLQSEKSRLQTELQHQTHRYQTLQNDHFKQQQSIEQLDNDRTIAINSSQHFQQTNEQLIHDHDQLQKLYTKLEQEFDTTINQLTDQRTANRMLTKECKYLQIELDTIGKEKQNLLNRISYLLKQIHQYESKLAEQKPLDEQYNYLQKQYQIRTEDFQETLNVNQELKQQIDQTKLELSKSRSELANLQMKYTNIHAEYANLITKYEFLEQQTERMEEEKSQLIEQLHSLVQQNQNVLAQALSHKDLFHEEARGYLEQLHQLMRQKELLEMKIMEQYKNMPIHKPRRSRGLIQSVSRKTRNILDRLANRRTRTSSADGHLFLGDSTERAISPVALSSLDQNETSLVHTRSTTPDVISSSLTSARHHQPTNSELLKNRIEPDRHHQSTDSLADSSSKDEEDESPISKETNTIKSSTPIRIDLQSKTPEFILNNHRQSPFRPIRDSPALQHSANDLTSNINNQRRCSSTQSFLIHPIQTNNNTLHSSIRRHRFHSAIIASPYLSQQQSTDQQTTSFNDHVLITEFGAI